MKTLICAVCVGLIVWVGIALLIYGCSQNPLDIDATVHAKVGEGGLVSPPLDRPPLPDGWIVTDTGYAFIGDTL